jgi:hypothetical protein
MTTWVNLKDIILGKKKDQAQKDSYLHDLACGV